MTATLMEEGHDVATLLRSFRLPTAAAEMSRRLEDAGFDGAIDVVREVLEAEGVVLGEPERRHQNC